MQQIFIFKMLETQLSKYNLLIFFQSSNQSCNFFCFISTPKTLKQYLYQYYTIILDRTEDSLITTDCSPQRRHLVFDESRKKYLHQELFYPMEKNKSSEEKK